MTGPRVVIVDYGMGNLHSVERALLQAGAQPEITSDPGHLLRADGLVLAGAGAFAPGREKLAQGGLGRRIVELARTGQPVLGVCLGYQLLFEESLEGGRHEGLGLLPGRVVEVSGTEHLPVIGWCQVRQTSPSTLWHGIADGSYFYFAHSYAPEDQKFAIGSTDHCPAAASGLMNVMGMQFHPEKSGSDGLRIYRNFLSICD